MFSIVGVGLSPVSGNRTGDKAMAKAVDEKREIEKQSHEREEGGNMNLDRFLKGLTDEEQRLYETCVSLLQSIGEDGNLEEACEWLEKKVTDKDKSSPTKLKD